MKCEKCDGTGVIETGNNDFPCGCAAGSTARFNVAGVTGSVPGAYLKKEMTLDGAIARLQGWANDWEQIETRNKEHAHRADFIGDRRNYLAEAMQAKIKRDAYLHAIRILKGED